jgi:hypothetical protein
MRSLVVDSPVSDELTNPAKSWLVLVLWTYLYTRCGMKSLPTAIVIPWKGDGHVNNIF